MDFQYEHFCKTFLEEFQSLSSTKKEGYKDIKVIIWRLENLYWSKPRIIFPRQQRES